LNIYLLHTLATFFLFVFIVIVLKKERRELSKIPLLRKIYR